MIPKTYLRMVFRIIIFICIMHITGTPRVWAQPSKIGVPLRPFRVQLDFKHYYTYEELTESMMQLEREFPHLAKVYSIGQSFEGRDIWLIEVANPATGNPDLKPAIYIDGNIHGNEIQAGEVSLYCAYYLLNRYEQDEYVRNLVDTRTFYIVPTVNPDSRYYFFAEPNTPHTPRWNRRPYDEDQDGRFDEDGYEDINNDGMILLMRMKNPFGSYREGVDERSIVERELDETGEYLLLGYEGIDNDGDGAVNEDPAGGADLNRNYPSRWKPHYVQPGAGRFPLSEPETKAVTDFLMSHPNIGAVQSFHNYGNMVLYPYGDMPAEALPERDLKMYKALGMRGEEILKEYALLNIHDDLYKTHGDEISFAYLHTGAMCFSNELWQREYDYNKDGVISEAELLKWNDERLHGRGFIPWESYQHPQYGAIEIGGWHQFAMRIPPADDLEDMCQRNTTFVLFHAASLPEVTFQTHSIKRIASGVYQVDAWIVNNGFMDSFPQQAILVKQSKPIRIRLFTSENISVVAGSVVDAHFPKIDMVRRRHAPYRQYNTVMIPVLYGRQEKRVQWVIQKTGSGQGWVQLQSESSKGGVDQTNRISLPD